MTCTHLRSGGAQLTSASRPTTLQPATSAATPNTLITIPESLQFHQRAVSRKLHEEIPPVSSPLMFYVKTLRRTMTSSQWARARRVLGSRTSLGQQNKYQDQYYKQYQNQDQERNKAQHQDQYQNQDQDQEQNQSNNSGATSTHKALY